VTDTTTSPPERSTYRHGDLRRALLEAGIQLARAGGPDAVVLREATRRAGVVPNAAYRHFASRWELLQAVRSAALSASSGGNSRITMGRGKNSTQTVEEGQDLANILKSGKLNAPAKIVDELVVGPTLGKAAVHGGAMAFAISFAVIFILMLVYFNTAGWVANIALILNLLFTIGVLSALGATLTAPGIAGLVLTIGMAVDTNVIIFERIKEELTRGKSYQLAVHDGYRRSLSSSEAGRADIEKCLSWTNSAAQ